MVSASYEDQCRVAFSSRPHPVSIRTPSPSCLRDESERQSLRKEPRRLDVAVVETEQDAAHRSATLECRTPSAVADSGTVQALTSLAMAPRQRLSGLPTSS